MSAPPDVPAARAAIAAAEARLWSRLASFTDAQAAEPSVLDGWTRGVLVRHIAVNAWSNAAMIDAALRGEHRPQYPGGDTERTALIEEGRGKRAAEVVADARAAAAELAAVFDRVPDDAWDLPVPAGIGDRPIRDRLRSRLVEVEVHHADLGLGYTPADWPADFVVAQLHRTVAALPGRASGAPEPGVWRVVASGAGAWDLDVAAPVVRVGPAGDDAARGEASGPPYAVLAWLIGRGAAGVTFAGDPAVAGLPAWFPWN